jgi:rRNA maturation endonuclease Nob1
VSAWFDEDEIDLDDAVADDVYDEVVEYDGPQCTHCGHPFSEGDQEACVSCGLYEWEN